MTEFGQAVTLVQDHVHRAVHKVSPFVERFARVGFAAKGIIYCVVGALAAMSVAGFGGRTTGAKGAMFEILSQPFGQVLLGMVALGLACYSLWQFIRAIEDPENEGSDARGVAIRIGYFISAVIHALLVIYAAQLILGHARDSGAGDDRGAQSWSATLMSYPAGQWALGLIGAGILIYGLFQLSQAYRAALDKQLVLERLDAQWRRWTIYLSRFGIAARGAVFGMIGVFLMLAAWRTDPGEARGLAGAMESLRQQPLGPWLLGAVAGGLVAYGIYQFILARYRRIEMD